MKRQIKIKNRKIDYLVKKSKRAKRLRLAVYCDGSFVITAPNDLALGRIENYILQKAEWVIEKLRIMRKRGKSKIFMRVSESDYKKLKDQALELATNRAEYYNSRYGLKYRKIFIRNQKTRWGSCSKNGNLSYNYKIALLPKKLADYIIVHELCHLKEFNHSRKYWNLVERAIPDYDERIEEIKKL
jgi:predicted metal-dependent hydrolase